MKCPLCGVDTGNGHECSKGSSRFVISSVEVPGWHAQINRHHDREKARQWVELWQRCAMRHASAARKFLTMATTAFARFSFVMAARYESMGIRELELAKRAAARSRLALDRWRDAA